MRIISFSIVRNECDIIESFVRYTLSYVDKMYITIAPSTDGTAEILEQLAREGAPLILIPDEASHHNQVAAMNGMMRRINECENADLLLPLDADEFYIGEGNPRWQLEQLGQDAIYSVDWKTFIPMDDDDRSIRFVPKRLRFARNEEHERTHKCVIPAAVARLPGAHLGMGSHSFRNGPEYFTSVPELRLAHIPVRSREQLMKKVLVGVLADMARKDRLPGESYHWYSMVRQILAPGGIDTTKAALAYGCSAPRIGIHRCSMDISFCPKPYVRYHHLIKEDAAESFFEAARQLIVPR